MEREEALILELFKLCYNELNKFHSEAAQWLREHSKDSNIQAYINDIEADCDEWGLDDV